MLEIINLNKSFKKKRAVDSFSYSFSNDVYALLGPNGAGKTTLMRCITNLYTPNSGEIKYNGKSTLNDKNFLSNVGYLPQKFGMFKELTVKEALLLLANLKGIDKSDANAGVEKSLELVNLSDRINSKVGALSGGMTRRLGIAQAIMGDPHIIIFDEPTAGLDPEERLRFKNIISQIKKDKIIIISTHIVDDVEAVCSQVMVMDDGKIIKTGSCEEIKETARGKMFVLQEGNEKAISGDFVLQQRFESDGKAMIKIISSVPQNLDKAQATLEDGYICALKGI